MASLAAGMPSGATPPVFAPPGAGAPQPSPVLVAVVLAVLTIAHTLPFGYATLVLDIARDFHAALAITGDVAGERWPLRGPSINHGMMSLGPAWFYILALPLSLGASIAATLWFVGALASTKFLFAFALGRRLLDARFGLLWAAMLSLPGWTSMQWIPTHFALLEASALLVALCLVALAQGGRRADWLAYGIAQSIALHAHPVTLVLAVALPVVLWRRRDRVRHDLPMLLLGFALSLLPFAPMLLAEWREGWPMLARSGAWLDQAVSGSPQPPWGPLLGLVWGGPMIFVRGLADSTFGGALSIALAVCYGAVAALGVAGLALAIVRGRGRALALAMLAATLLADLWVWWIEPETSFYVALMVFVPLAGSLALGVHRCFARSARGWLWPLAIATVLGVAGSALFVLRSEQGRAWLPTGAASDIAAVDKPAVEVALLPATRLRDVAELVCASARPIVLHTELGLLTDTALGLSPRILCDRGHGFFVGGGAALSSARHRLGLLPETLRRLGVDGADWPLALSLQPERVIAADYPLDYADGSLYPPRVFEAGAPATHTIRFVAPAGEVVAIGAPTHFYDGTTVVAARTDGAPATRLTTSLDVPIYGSDATSGEVAWEIDVHTGFPQRVDVVTFDPDRLRRASSPSD